MATGDTKVNQRGNVPFLMEPPFLCGERDGKQRNRYLVCQVVSARGEEWSRARVS